MRRKAGTFQYVLVLCGIRKRYLNLTPPQLHFTRIWSLPILLCVLFSLTGTCTAQSQCTDNSGCFPTVGNLATGRSINVSSTCGVGSEYCIFFSSEQDCSTCLPESVNSPSSINDNNNNTAWFSEIGPNSVTTNIQIDFEGPVMFQGMTMVWQSVRPRSMLLERSQDFGATWQIYRYYSSSCTDSFMLPDTFVTDTSVFNTTTPICTSTQSQLFPFQDGLVTFSTSQHISQETVDAIKYRTVTNLRVQLIDRFVEIALSEQRFQYYSLSEWLIWGSCLCNGHAAMCTPGNGEMMAIDKVNTECICEHNTEGSNCDNCLVGYNNAPWMPGTQTDANQCQECMCNGHANDCEYNTTQSLGICLNCTDNTTGNNCELCLPGFYQDETLLLNDPGICTPCSCSLLGSVDNGLCSNNGQCNCKLNVGQDTLDCSQCRDGYWNLTESNPVGCEACDCNTDGTILAPNGLPFCDKNTGKCLCREGATGNQCESCMPGFYDISAGCLPCQCNQGGSVSSICDQNSNNAQCPCIPNVELTTCRVPEAGYYSKALDDILFEAEEATLLGDAFVVIPLPAGSVGPLTGRGFVSLVSFSSVQFIFTAPQNTQYELIMRYEVPTPGISVSFTLISLSPVTFDLNCDTTTSMNVSRFNFASTLPESERFYVIDSVCLSREVSYRLTVEDTSFALTRWMIDSLLLLPDFSAISAYYANQTAQDQRTIIEPCLPRQASVSQMLLPECEEPTFTLSTEFYGSVFACECDQIGSNSTTCYRYSGSCTCQPRVTRRQCDMCIPGTFNLSNSGCQLCDCDAAGSIDQICDQEGGGICMCRPGVGGRRCNQCLEGFYNFSANGCSPCLCSEYALLDTCDSDGQCLCPFGVTGLYCDQCQQNFYNISVDGCTPCSCNPAGSLSSACDAITGICTCVGGSSGMNCNICPDGFFLTDGNVRDRCVRCTCMGQTNDCEVDNESYGLGLLLSNFSALCSNNPSECDDGWIIRTADGDLAAPYGPSDSNGLGYILLVNHMPMLYAPDEYLGDRQASYGLSFSAFLRISNTGALNINTTIMRIIGSEFEQELIGIFPYPTVTLNGFGAERYLEYTIPFIEESWHVGSSTGPTPTFNQFINVLSNLTELSFSAQYTEDIIEFVHIVNISLETILPAETFVNSTDNLTMSIVPVLYPFPTENCQCPEGYSDRSCGECSPGFARSSGFPTDPCIRCDCNNQSLDCDQITGVCINCQGRTEGDYCERCITGYYGDPTNSIECLPCECPLLDNSFSPTCILNETDGLSTCDSCAVGYTGRNCELCMDGYFGNPLLGRCTTCECNGNVDPTLGPVCDTMTGRCMNCQNNTTGFECELCLPGYFGDPQIGKSCQRCPCNSEGTVGDCDSLFGTCVCQRGATGQLCDECIDGYWGISQGCILCECCTDGTIGNSGVCDKETGACICKLNVGSEVDDKCCNCTPGYFSFTDQGCQACNCSALAVSEECDQITGACVCQDGAQGLKCDDCSYGYSGQVPNCERCHDCFFQWDDDINYLRQRIAGLQLQISNLIEENFNDTDLDMIQMEFNLLLEGLQQANGTLNIINLQESSIEELHRIIINMNTSFNGYYEDVEDIENELAEAQLMLDRTRAFNGTVNMTTVNDLLLKLLTINATIEDECYRANQTLTRLQEQQVIIKDTWLNLNMLNTSAHELLVNLTIARADTEEAEMLLQEFYGKYNILRRNLSSLAVHFDMLRGRFLSINQTATTASVSLDNAETKFDFLVREVDTRIEEANQTLTKAMQLNSTINTTQAIVQMTLDSVNELLSFVIVSVTNGNSTLDDIADALAMTDVVESNLTQIKTVANQIFNLTISFNIRDADILAQEINETILPPEVVDEIVQNAAIVKQAANQTLALAMETSDSVIELESLVQQLQDNLNSTNVTQQQVAEDLSIVQGIVEDTQEQIEKVNVHVTEVENQAQQAQEIFDNATNSIGFSRELGMNNTMRVMDIHAKAVDVAYQSEQSRNDIYQAIDDYNKIESRISSAQAEANLTYAVAVDLHSRAGVLSAEAKQVSLQELKDLLQRYNEESAQVATLQESVRGLQQRLEYLTKSFERASQRLQNCYKTP